MKKGSILAFIVLLLLAAGWGYYSYGTKNAPAPTNKVDTSLPSNNTPEPTTGLSGKTAPDEKPADNSPAAEDKKAAAQTAIKAEQPVSPLASNTSKPTTPLNAAAAIEQAKANGESMWLLFRSQSCAPCVEMKKVFDQLQPDYKGKVRFISIDVDDAENRELVEEWRIQYIPATFILNTQGKLSYENVGFFPVEDLKKELDRVVK